MRPLTALALFSLCAATSTLPAQQRATLFGLPSTQVRRGVVDPTTGEALLPSASALPRRDWVFSPTLRAWQPRPASATMPNATFAFSLVADTRRNRVVLFGGSDDGTFRGSDETWEWDGTDWRRISTTTQPSPRTAAAACFDSVRGRLVLFGGLQDGMQLQDTWEYDGTAWSLRPTPRRPGPGASRLAFDPVRGVSVLRGSDGTWEWDGSAWNGPLDRTPIAPSPGIDLVWEGATGSVVTTGGNGTLEAWDGSTWTMLPTNTVPLGITTVLSLPGREGLLAVGRDTRTWVWDGTTWQRRGTPGSAPGYGGDRMVYDSNRDRLLLLDGDGNVFTFDPPRNAWRQLNGGTSGPVRGSYFCVTFDAARDRLVAFGTTGSLANPGETLVWDPTTLAWQTTQPATRPTGLPQGMVMEYDPVRERCVLFGGLSTLNSPNPPVWEWDGSDWHRIDTSFGPNGRQNPALAFDVDREVMVMVGNGTTDLWEWDGTAWTSRGVLQPGGATVWMPAVYHSARRRMQVLAETSRASGPAVFEIDLERATWSEATIAGRGLDDFGFGSLWNLAHAPTTETTWMVYSGSQPVRALRSVNPARAVRFGNACANSAGSRPRLSGVETRQPWIGDRLGFEVTDLAASTRFATLLVGASDARWPGGSLPFDLTPLGLTGCALQVSPDLTVPLQAQGGRIEDRLAVPNERALVGDRVFLQVLALDQAANPGGVVATGALRLTLGAR